MSDGARLAALLDELGSDPRYATGERRFRGAVSDDDAAELAEAMMAEVDVGIGVRGKQAADQGLTVACRRGCAACCEEMIMVWAPEALAVARWLSRPENTGARERFLRVYASWRAEVGDVAARLAACSASGDRPGHMAAYMEHWGRRIPCAFNDEGACTIYEIRPIKCRNAHALDSADACAGDAPGSPARLTFPPLAEFIDKTRDLYRAAHHALGRPRERPAALCDAVHEILTGASGTKVSRNAPCPCGSGLKFKRCCGA